MNIEKYLHELNSSLDSDSDSVAVILAAGHGKRIKSETSKMLHEIWGVPTVVRVAAAAEEGLATGNQIIVVGIKAVDVADVVGKNDHRIFVFQAEQNGTGDAVRIALNVHPGRDDHEQGDVYIFPGDMGLLSARAVRQFREDFLNNPCDMMVLTGLFEGDPAENYYGRIIRVPERDADGRESGEDTGKVIEIKEHKDILALDDDNSYYVDYKGRIYRFFKNELLDLREFNTGVYAFKTVAIKKHITRLKTDNVQGELYLTDLISLYNRNGLTVKAAPAKDNRSVLGFNVKSVLKEMDNYARAAVYEELKDMITIEDRDDFFIADEVVKKIVELDDRAAPLDIYIGKGAYIGKHVELSKGVRINNSAFLDGNILLAEGVRIQENVTLSTYANQILKIGKNTEIFKGDIVKGNLQIGEDCQVESGVNITGSDEWPTRIGARVTIKGTTYIFGCIVDGELVIERSVLKCKHVEKRMKSDGTIQNIRYVLPTPEGLDSISEIN
jgi:bifunctional UDP-N-acetylglucosamine pyrophosphorylase/glucosamine-1-phosphate N-acetyltransferase